MSADIFEAAMRAGKLSALDLKFAEFICSQAKNSSPELALAAALCSHATGEGHVCIDLRRVAGQSVLGDMCAPEFGPWCAALEAGDVVAAPGGFAPLVLDAGRLYLYRYWRYEVALAEALRARAEAITSDAEPERVRAVLERYFPRRSDGVADEQKRAAALAALQSFAIISGGPGTGKTTTAIRVLAVLAELAQPKTLRIAMAAPTGKAAARLQEALRAARTPLRLPPLIEAQLPHEATTLHRLLGVLPGRTRFRHDRDHPLPLDVLVVDEASMIDIALMAKLLDALPAQTRLIVLGDKDQLASVEAGAVLGGLCAGEVIYSPAFAARLRAAGGEEVGDQEAMGERVVGEQTMGEQVRGEKAPKDNALSKDVLNAGTSNKNASNEAALSQSTSNEAASNEAALNEAALNKSLITGRDEKRSAIADCIALLRQSHRFDSAGGIGALAAAAVRGDSQSLMQLLQGGANDVTWQSQATYAELIVAMAAQYLPLLEAAQTPLAPEQAFELMHQQGILCALRHGPYGAMQINIAIEAVLRKRGLISAGGEWYAGRPVMMTRNDYGLQLFNGETGIALREAQGTLAVFFPAVDGGLRRFTPARIVACETAFALTVHKAQGSEFENIALILPSEASPVLGRELLYTAITRAMHKLSVWGSVAVLKAALEARIERSSALAERVWR